MATLDALWSAPGRPILTGPLASDRSDSGASFRSSVASPLATTRPATSHEFPAPPWTSTELAAHVKSGYTAPLAEKRAKGLSFAGEAPQLPTAAAACEAAEHPIAHRTVQQAYSSGTSTEAALQALAALAEALERESHVMSHPSTSAREGPGPERSQRSVGTRPSGVLRRPAVMGPPPEGSPGSAWGARRSAAAAAAAPARPRRASPGADAWASFGASTDLRYRHR
jgi:hypothetical protein